MRRLAFGLCVVWMVIAFMVRMYDMRQPQTYVSALTGGQHHHLATLAWIEGKLRGGEPSHGRLVVVDVRLDGKIMRYASGSLPLDWPECRLWLEEGPEVVQAVARCPGHAPLRLTAQGTSVLGLGPDNKPATLYDLYPLTTIEPEKIVNKIHRSDLAPAHPLLFVFGLLCIAPLFVSARRELGKARRLGREPVLEGVMERAGDGVVTIRSGERRVQVFVEKGEVISVGLGRDDVAEDATMAVDGLCAAVQGEVHEAGESVFRGREAMRLKPGAVLIVGDVAVEARRRFMRHAMRDAALGAAAVAVFALVAAGMAW